MKPTHEELERYGRQADITIENLEQQLAESKREFRAADATIENLQMKLNAEREAKLALAAENAGLKSEVPMGAIENGRAFADRLEVYQFECQGGNLNMCSDWQELRRCFEHLSEWAMHGQPETPATNAFLSEVLAQGVEMFAASLKVAGGHEHPYSAVANDFAAQLRNGGAA